MDIIENKDKQKLYTQIKHLLGAPIRAIELTEEMMDSFLEMSLSEYEQYVQDWLIESQWSSLYGLNVEEQSIAKAFITRNLDYETQYTYAYSKIVGLQAGGPWILQKDYVVLEAGKQIYEIPAGRELNEILWYTRAELNESVLDPYLGGFSGLGGFPSGMAQMGGQGSFHMLPAFDLLLRMQDRNLKNRLIGGELTYKITASTGGTKNLHLMNIPGGRFDFGTKELNQSVVWYWYYDTNDREACLKENPDVVKLPSDIETQEITWGELNLPSKNWVRKFFAATCKEALGRVRGKFMGDLKIPDAELRMEYESLLTEGKDEKMKLVEELSQRLERLRPDKMLERKGMEAENLNKSLKYRPFQSPINPI